VQRRAPEPFLPSIRVGGHGGHRSSAINHPGGAFSLDASRPVVIEAAGTRFQDAAAAGDGAG
jgi:hypothetical protein